VIEEKKKRKVIVAEKSAFESWERGIIGKKG
jgi:hypothetical protein